jgi:nicotinamide-nucleotide amidase
MQDSPEQHVGRVLTREGKTLATAESCTGGLLGDRITSVPGSSVYYLGGVIAYANDVKEYVLGVLKETMIKHGAVSEETALEMARGARKVLKTDYGISVTGIAGPSGGTLEKPVGLTWVAVSGAEGEHAAKYIYPGDREANKHAAVDSVLELLLQVIELEKSDLIKVDTKRDKHGRLIPTSFTWHENHYTIVDWGRRWRDDDREHMLVRAKRGETFELAFDELEVVWKLIRKLRTPHGPTGAV